MERNYLEKIHGNDVKSKKKTFKQLQFLIYQKLMKRTAIFCLSKSHQNMH